MDTISFELTKHEAHVLFEFLARCSDSGQYAFVDQAEQRAVWNLEATLEPLVPVLSPDYEKLVQEARGALRDRD